MMEGSLKNHPKGKLAGFGLLATVLIILCAVPGALADIIIDNGDPGTSYAGGPWGYSSGANPYNGTSQAESRDGATYTFITAASGDQTVSLWWTWWSSRCSSVPVDIYDGNQLLATVPVNQQQIALAGQWNVLGTYTFTGTATAVIRARSGCSACADAVKFSSVEEAKIDHVAIDGPLSVDENTSAQYTLRAYYDNGTNRVIAAYSWEISCPSYTEISATGLLSAGEVYTNEVCTITASYYDNGTLFTDTYQIVIKDYVASEEVVVDNDGPGTSFAGGSWGYSSGANPYNGTSRAESRDGATYTFQAPVSGNQTVSLWWTYWSSRCSSVPVDIYDGNQLLATVPVNQQQIALAGKWNVVGTYAFTGTARAVVRARSGCSSCADAVKFTSTAGAEFDHLAIEGPLAVTENTSAQYALRAYYANGSDKLITADSWKVSCPDYANISASGLLSAFDVLTNEGCTITATYNDGGAVKVATLDIFINNYVLPEVEHIAIEGPLEVNENTNTQYSLRAHFADGTDQLVAADYWEVSCPSYADITDTGLFSAREVSANQTCDIIAAFSDGDIFFTDSYEVVIKNYTSPIIIDNDAPGTSYTGGHWGYSSGANPYGGSSRAESISGATYTFQAAVTGGKKVSLWWTYWSSRCSAVPVDIYDGTQLLATILVDQQQLALAGQWNALGTYMFTGTARVVIRAQSGCSTNADAVKFENAEVPALRRIRIEGNLVIHENSSEKYVVRADYMDGSSRYVTPDSLEVSCPSYASASVTGLVTANEVDADKTCLLTATYTEAGISQTRSNNLIIKNIIRNGNILRHKFTVDLDGRGQIFPVMGDVDGDGNQEIVLTVEPRKLMVLNGKTGAVKWTAEGSSYAVELADLNKDGIPEILVGLPRRGTTGPRVRAYRGDGSILWTSRPLEGDKLSLFPITTADINGDGYPTIYFLTEDTDPDPYSGNMEDYKGALYMLDHKGNVLRQTWVWHPCWGGMTIGDYNNDGVFEIYVSDRRRGFQGMTESKGIQAYNAHTLEFLWGRPDLQHSSPLPVLADVLGNGTLQVVATEITLKGPLVLNPATGETVPGYDYGNRGLPTHGTPTVYDIDGDGNLEYITATSYPYSAPQKFVVFDLIKGTLDFETFFKYCLAWPPSVGDVTGNGQMEILAATGDQPDVRGDNFNGSYPLVIYDKNFKMIDWIDMPEGTGQLTPARLYDTDGDGYLELVIAGFYGKLMVFKTNSPTPNPAPRSWVQFYSQYRRGAAEYVPPPGY
jgi:hypothetical protein